VEDFLGFALVILAIVSSIAKKKKKKQQAQARKQVRQEIAAKQQTKAPYSMEALQAWFEEENEETPPAKPAAAQEATHEGIHPCDTHSSEPAKVAQPRIQSRVQVTEKPRVVLGSMGVDSHEGIHPCDEHEEDLVQNDKPLIAMPVEKPGIQLEWTGDNMVKAFIMQEVLTRPGQRRRA